MSVLPSTQPTCTDWKSITGVETILDARSGDVGNHHPNGENQEPLTGRGDCANPNPGASPA